LIKYWIQRQNTIVIYGLLDNKDFLCKASVYISTCLFSVSLWLVCSFTLERVADLWIFRHNLNPKIKTMLSSSLPPVVCRDSCLIYVICVCLCRVVSNILCCVFALFSWSVLFGYISNIPTHTNCFTYGIVLPTCTSHYKGFRNATHFHMYLYMGKISFQAFPFSWFLWK